MVLYHTCMRVGWIFKTESIIMPAVVDAITGQLAWVRGMLPLLNRFGQSVPPLLAAHRIKGTRQKKWAQTVFTLLMAGCFLTLSAVWFFKDHFAAWVLPTVFLSCYFLFFGATGVNMLTFNTLQGKLIKATHRGRLLLCANLVGASAAILCAILFMPDWLGASDGDFKMLFGFTALCFVGAAALASFLSEPADDVKTVARPVAKIFSDAWRLIRFDATFQLLAVVASLFGASMMLFPHYQKLGFDALGFSRWELVVWVVIQNGGTAIFSVVIGPIADRFGNRLVLHLLLLGVASAPVTALVLAAIGNAAADYYVVVFLLVGMTPVTLRTLNNYALELVKPEEHPRYLSSLSLCIGAPVLLSPILGLFVGWVGFTAPFCLIIALLVTAWLLSFRLPEPRHW